ncbi:RluA family pseudouridine synthase [Pelagibacteraceae bacterium]|jgi:23S rRNA pseudouridine1911/1915/1917 synthase|nr:RluA family pseudouridine synthase [Pelagibacteraceae bacterium]
MSNNSTKFSIKEEDSGNRLDIILAKLIPDLTRSNLKKIIELKEVKINNSIEKSPSKKLKTNDVIEINLRPVEKIEISPTKINLDIVHEDKDILIINKPAGMVVHPGAGNYKETLVNALIYKYKNSLSDINGNTRPGIVHRIDKETSGLLVVAKNNKAHSNLGKQFSDHTIQRTYQALAWGVLRPLNGRIETLIGRSRKNRQLMSVSEITGKKSITNYKTLKIFNIKDIPKITFVECKLETGRTHQIRVHMAYMGNSLLGDQQYGKKNVRFKKINEEFEDKLKVLNRQALHAKSLGFIHPTTKKLINFESKLPKDFKKILDLLNKLSH